MAQARALFLELGVRDVAASRAFFAALGFPVDERFTSDRTACLVLNELSWVMLVEDGPEGPRAGPGRLRASAATAQEADDLALRAAALGARVEPASACIGVDGVHARAFRDLDGHRWELVWLSEARLAHPPTPTHEVR